MPRNYKEFIARHPEAREHDAADKRARRAELWELGLCGDCGKSSCGDFSYCEPCRKRRQEYNDKKRRRRSSSGLCEDCNEPATIGLKCEKHRERMREYARRSRERRKANGLCSRCGSTGKEPTKVGCRECAVTNKVYQQSLRLRRKLAGQCLRCSLPAVEGSQCCAEHKDYHKDASRKSYLKHRAERLEKQRKHDRARTERRRAARAAATASCQGLSPGTRDTSARRPR